MEARTPHERAIETAVRRILAEEPAARYEVWRRLGDVLAADGAPRSVVEDELAERAEALKMIREAARRLDKPEGVWPQTREFNALKLPGWNHHRVARAWGRYSFAIDKLNGGVERPTPAQRDAIRRAAGQEWAYDDPITCLRRYGETCPASRSRPAYDAWSRVQKQEAVEGELLTLNSAAILDNLGIPWTEAWRVVDGEITLSEARTSKMIDGTWSNGPHDLVARPGVARILDVPQSATRGITGRAAFPKPALTIGRTPAWLREDVEAYRDGRPFAKRRKNHLQSLYITVEQLASELHVTKAALRQPKAAVPAPTGAVANQRYWLKVDVEEWLKSRPSPYSGRGRHERAAGTKKRNP